MQTEKFDSPYRYHFFPLVSQTFRWIFCVGRGEKECVLSWKKKYAGKLKKVILSMFDKQVYVAINLVDALILRK